eukprot:scaffold43260_cov23-Tisochrysis_lutea.AAC.1
MSQYLNAICNQVKDGESCSYDPRVRKTTTAFANPAASLDYKQFAWRSQHALSKKGARQDPSQGSYVIGSRGASGTQGRITERTWYKLSVLQAQACRLPV